LAWRSTRNSSTGTWEDKANYFDVTVWGAQAENCDRYLSKGRPVAIDGRLEWREYEARDGSKRQAVEIIAEIVQFLGATADAQADLARTRVNPRAGHPYRRRARSARTRSRSEPRAKSAAAVGQLPPAPRWVRRWSLARRRRHVMRGEREVADELV
jgi:single stranded DNA-binding protein